MNKFKVFVLVVILGLSLAFIPRVAWANTYGQGIYIQFSDGGTQRLTSDGGDICYQVNSIFGVSNCDYPNGAYDSRTNTHYVYAVRNTGSVHQPVVTHPGSSPSYPTQPQSSAGQIDQIFVTTTNQWVARNGGEDVCTQIRRQFGRECIDYRDLGQGRHQVSLGNTLHYPTQTHQNRPTVFCLGGTGTDVSGAICIH